jgi:hypothetical protein
MVIQAFNQWNATLNMGLENVAFDDAKVSASTVVLDRYVDFIYLGLTLVLQLFGRFGSQGFAAKYIFFNLHPRHNDYVN